MFGPFEIKKVFAKNVWSSLSAECKRHNTPHTCTQTETLTSTQKKRHRTLGDNNECARSCTITSQLPVDVAVKQLSRWLAIGCSIDGVLFAW